MSLGSTVLLTLSTSAASMLRFHVNFAEYDFRGGNGIVIQGFHATPQCPKQPD